MGVLLCCTDCQSSEITIHPVSTFNEVETRESNLTMMPSMYTSNVAEREHVTLSRLSMSTPVLWNHSSKNSSSTTSSGATETAILTVKKNFGVYGNNIWKILSPTIGFHESKDNGTVSSVISISTDDDERLDRNKSQWSLRSDNSYKSSSSGTSIFRLQLPDTDESFSGNGTTNVSGEIKDVSSNGISSKFPSSPETGTLRFKLASMSQMLQKLLNDNTVFSQSLEQVSEKVTPRLQFTSTVARSKERKHQSSDTCDVSLEPSREWEQCLSEYFLL